jgi:hypothetical protein
MTLGGPAMSGTATTPYPKPPAGDGTFAGATPGRPRSRRLGLAAGALALALLAAAAAWSFLRRPGPLGAAAGGVAPPADVVEVNIAYGTEKKKWLEDALREYRETPAGQRSRIRLIGMGSVEGARAILDGPGPTPIHVWSPASSVYLDAFERQWAARRKGRPIARADDLALTPMVFVMWKARYDEFVKKYDRLSFRTVGEAMREPDGWGTIAGKTEWGLFKFGHTDPLQSNSGLVALVLMAYGNANKQRGLTVEDITRPPFREWLTTFERGVTRHGGSLTHSTGTLMEEMIKRGPSQYDCLLVYENLAIDYMKQARDRWGEQGELYVSYPDPNLWNEHPYYILDVPWSGPRERAAAADFLAFLMSEPIQRRALDHGFRPGNPSVSVTFPDSPLVKNRKSGLRLDVPRICEPPRADVVDRLLSAFGHIEP